MAYSDLRLVQLVFPTVDAAASGYVLCAHGRPRCDVFYVCCSLLLEIQRMSENSPDNEYFLGCNKRSSVYGQWVEITSEIMDLV